MMNRFLSAGLLSLLFCSNLYSILPPLYNSIEEINTLINDPGISEHLSSADVILSIERTDNGWVIKGNKNTAQADVIALPQKMPGPAKYRVIWKNPEH